MAVTNVESTTTTLIVKCKSFNCEISGQGSLTLFAGHNSFVMRLPDTAECSEHCRMVFTLTLRDREAPVTFYLDK